MTEGRDYLKKLREIWAGIHKLKSMYKMKSLVQFDMFLLSFQLAIRKVNYQTIPMSRYKINKSEFMTV